MQPSTSRIIQCLRQTLTQRLGPRLKDRDAQDLVAAMDFALCELLHRAEDRESLRRASNDQLRALLLRGYEWLDVPAPSLPAGNTLGGELRDALEAESDALRHAAAELIERLPLSVHSSRDERTRAGKDLLRAILRTHVDETIAELAPLPVATASIADPLAFDRGKLAQDIEVHLQRSKPITIEAVENLSGGFSRATLAIQWSDGTTHENLVVRKQKPAPLMSSVALDVADEFPLLTFLHAHGMAVPAQHWLQTDPSVMGGDFIAMDRAGGRSLGSALGATGVNDAIMREIAEQIARLHRLPWEEDEAALARAFKLEPGNIDANRSLDVLLKRWDALETRSNLRPSPARAAARRWLQLNRPTRHVRPTLLHGDIGFHNMLFDGDRLTALLDWETAFLGDPAKDIATCQSFVGLYTAWDRFLGWYLDAGGYQIDAAAVRYYNVLRVYTQLIVGDIGHETKFAHDPTTEIEYFILGGPVRAYFTNDYSTCLDIICE